MADGKVIIETGLDKSGIEAGLKKLGKVAKAGLGVTTKAIAGVGTALTGAAGLAVKSGIDFESAFAGVKKTVDATDQELAEFRQGIRDMAKEMPTAATEIAGVAEAAGQLGIKNESLLSFTKTMTMLGDSTNMSAEEAATSLARLANITGMPQENFDRLGATIVDLGNNLATTESEIVAMSLRIAGAGSQVGMTEAQIMSFSGALSSVGIEAEAGGTAFSTLLSKMNLASSKGGKELEQFGKVAGMSAEEFKKAFQEDASGAVLSFIQGLGQINENGGSAIQTLDEMGLSDIRMRDALLRASGASDVFAEALRTGNSAWEKNTALTNEAKQRYETLESKLGILKNTATDLGISMYDSLENPLRGVVDTATDMVGSLETAFQKDGFSGLAEQAGAVLADASVKMAEAAPDMIEAGAKTIKSFADGIMENRGEIAEAAGEVAIALAEGVGELLPKGIGNAFKNTAKAAVAVAKPVLKVADAMAQVAAECSGAIPIIVGVGAAFKVSSFMDNFASALKLVKVGQQATTKSTIANTIATKLNTATAKTASASKVYQAAVEKSLEAATTASTLKMGTYTVAQRASAAASGVAAVATKGFSAALSMMGGPVGVAITLVGLAAGALLTFSDNSDKATSAVDKQAEKVKELSDAYRESKKSREESFESTEAEAAAASDLTGRISSLAKKTRKTADEKARLKSYVDQLNKLMPDLNLKYDEENDKLNKNTDELWNNVAAVQAHARAKAAETAATEALTEQMKLQREMEKAQDARDDAKQALDSVPDSEKYIANGRGGKVMSSEYASKIEEFNKADESVKNLQKDLNAANREVEYYNGIQVDSLKWEEAMRSTDAFIALMADSGLKISNKLAEGIRAGKYGVVQSVEDVQNVGTFSKLSKTAGEGGKKAVNTLAKNLRSGKLKPKKAVDEMQALIQFNELYKGADKGGKEALNALKKSIESGKTKPSEAMKQVVEAANKKGEAKGKEAKKIGEAIDSGAAGGINTKLIEAAARMAKDALEAAKKEIDSHSPSRKFKNEVGKMMVAGVVAGINSEKNNLISTTSGLMSSTVNAAKQAATTGNFADIGKNFTDSFTSKIDARQTSEVNSLKKTLENKQKSIVTADKKEEQALEKKIKKSSGKQKKAYQAELKALKKKHKSEQSAAKSASSKILKAYESALKQESQKLIDQAEKNIEELSNTYQAKYDELIQKREAMRDKLMDTGDLLISKTGNLSGLNEVNSGNPMTALNRNVKALEKYQKNITAIKGKIPDDLMEEILKMGVSDANSYINKLLKMEDGKFDEYVSKWKSEQATVKALEDQYLNTNTLGSLQSDIDQMRQYQNGLNSLKGRIPESMMEEILGMGVNDANAYMQQLLALSNTQFATYVEQWRQKEALANSISTEFFAQDIQTIQTNYSNAINTEMSKLKTQMSNLGKNVGKAFASGLKSQSKKSKKAVKDICNTVIKQCKKSLGIKSPSRVFKEIGKLSMVGAEVGTEKEAKQLYKTTDKVAQTYAERFSAAKLDAGAMYAKMQAAVVAEQSRVPASVQTQIVKLQAQQPERSEQRVVYEIHVHSDIDGREAAKAMATFTDEELGKIAKRKERR
ncbi:phage tail tape measure protein [Ihubacter massiliensis]|uniref:phage tail tape measure protein n=1 Tax=Ihubacter massiliensis TaxID=1852367 RepID=UPI002096DDCC|nr:phage tail tape measure protein [Ihubacter massiliensis]MCO7121911.1 phage tail tape measure protein [Ihubacter massiliensis]